MKVTYDSGDVLIRMTADQLITLRYALHEGAWRIGFLRLTRLRIDGVPVESPPARMGQARASTDWLEQR